MAQALMPRMRRLPEAEKTVQVVPQAHCWVGSHSGGYPKGTTLEVPETLANALLESGQAITPEAAKKAAEPPAAVEKPSATPEHADAPHETAATSEQAE